MCAKQISEKERKMCLGKRQHKSLLSAEHVLSLPRGTKKNENLEIYKCEFCEFYHIGHRRKGTEKKEYIICSAHHYNDGKVHVHQPTNIKIGFITTGLRHHNCHRTFSQIMGFPYSPEALKIKNTEIQGFITNRYRFVDRKEAALLAYAARQITKTVKELHSEDLY